MAEFEAVQLLERGAFWIGCSALLSNEVAAGHGRLVLIGGEAGVGKTSLVRHFGATVTPSVRVLEGACDPLATPRPLGPLLDIATALGGELQQHLQGRGPPRCGVSALLAELTQSSQPSLVILEDVHWADEATLDLLRFLGRRIGAARALLLATYRDDEVGPRHPLRVCWVIWPLRPRCGASSCRRLSEAAVGVLAGGSDLDAAALYWPDRGQPVLRDRGPRRPRRGPGGRPNPVDRA